MAISILVGTNRPLARSLEIGQYYQKRLQARGEKVQLLSLDELPPDFAFSALYQAQGKNEKFNAFVEKFVASEKFIFIVPEYNGSFPGILKTFLDGLPYPSPLRYKKIALVGLSTGVQGATLALSHLTDIFHYLVAEVVAHKVRIPEVHKQFQNQDFINPIYPKIIEEQLDLLIGVPQV
ncbi:NADPH-dependent FMN reductase [Hugenholtzia roseola]|uniref:NADPH-dependent FMN reductase n=1 Tax=Hugenholtzia roseola TaxID=1002 RepID=UPI000418706B|nr:NADPH-dependent FMN reductase [Hugenholtzia roseola]